MYEQAAFKHWHSNIGTLVRQPSLLMFDTQNKIVPLSTSKRDMVATRYIYALYLQKYPLRKKIMENDDNDNGMSLVVVREF